MTGIWFKKHAAPGSTLKNPDMRAQLETPMSGRLSIDKVSLSCFIKYYQESYTDFPGGKVYSFFTNSTLERSLVDFSDSTYSSSQKL